MFVRGPVRVSEGFADTTLFASIASATPHALDSSQFMNEAQLEVACGSPLYLAMAFIA